MRVTRLISEVNVVGRIWTGQEAAYTYPLSAYDIENIVNNGDGAITRDAVQSWLDCHAGDFQSIKDFQVTISTPEGNDFDSGWETEEGELLYSDCMFGES